MREIENEPIDRFGDGGFFWASSLEGGSRRDREVRCTDARGETDGSGKSHMLKQDFDDASILFRSIDSLRNESVKSPFLMHRAEFLRVCFEGQFGGCQGRNRRSSSGNFSFESRSQA